MTFHAACCRILRRYIDHLGYDPRFTIYDTADSERVIKDILRERSLDEKSFPPRLILSLSLIHISGIVGKRVDLFRRYADVVQPLLADLLTGAVPHGLLYIIAFLVGI